MREALRHLDTTMQRSPTFDPADSDREFSIAASDYTVAILAEPLLRLVNRIAPKIRLHLNALPAGLSSSGAALAMHDLLIGPVGFDFPGRHTELFRDRLVCVVDPVASGLAGPALSLADLSRLPHAEPAFAPGQPTPVDRVLEELGITRRVRITMFGWLSVPFALAGHRDGRDHAGADGAAGGPQRPARHPRAAVRPGRAGGGRLLAAEQDRRPGGALAPGRPEGSRPRL